MILVGCWFVAWVNQHILKSTLLRGWDMWHITRLSMFWVLRLIFCGILCSNDARSLGTIAFRRRKVVGDDCVPMTQGCWGRLCSDDIRLLGTDGWFVGYDVILEKR